MAVILGEVRETMKLAVPLIIGQVSQMLLGVVDTLMIGRLGVTEMAALTFANSIFYVPFVFGIGVLTAMSVFTAGARGKGDKEAGRASCRLGVYIALVLGIVLVAGMLILSKNLWIFRQPEDVAVITEGYFMVISLSLIPGLISLGMKNHGDALDRPWPGFWIFLGGVGLNVFLNWVMIFGNLGCPKLGLEGGAWATLISRVAIVGGMFFWFYHGAGMRDWVPKRWWVRAQTGEVKRFLGIGLPASVQMVCEVGAFSAAGLMMGWFGERAMAAHQIALMCAATAFMVPLGLAMALSVRIGAAAGAGEVGRLRGIAVSGWWLGVVWAVLGVSLFVFGGDWLAGFFIDQNDVVELAAQILIVVGVFQLFDSLQVSSVAMLRGLEDTRMPALWSIFSYWVVGIPLATWFSVSLGGEAVGVWWGLAVGLATSALIIGPRLWKFTQVRPSEVAI